MRMTSWFESLRRQFGSVTEANSRRDGKVNYGKFGDLLGEAKAITGGKDDE